MRPLLLRASVVLSIVGASAFGSDAAGTPAQNSCDSDGVTTSYTVAWDVTDKRYEVNAVTVGGVSDDCDGRTLRLFLADASGEQIGTGAITIPSNGAVNHSITLAVQPAAEDVTGIRLSIPG